MPMSPNKEVKVPEFELLYISLQSLPSCKPDLPLSGCFPGQGPVLPTPA